MGHDIDRCITSNPKLFSGWTTDNQSVEQHVNRIRKLGSWGSHLELKAAATLFQKTIYVATDSLVQGQCKWITFPPFPEACLPKGPVCFDVLNQKSWLEICYTGACHYDGVLPIRLDVPHSPPTLTGTRSTIPQYIE